MGILDVMDASVYSVVETQWDTTCPKFCKMIKQKIKEKDTYAKVSFASNLEETYLNSWKTEGGNSWYLGEMRLLCDKIR